jgi:hypothetical protein
VVPQPYLASYLYYRPQLPNVALHPTHARPPPELLAQWGNDGITNSLGARPAFIYDLGGQFRVAGDSGSARIRARDPQRTPAAAWRAPSSWCPWVEFAELRRAITDFFNQASIQTDPALPETASRATSSATAALSASVPADMLIGGGYNFASFTNLHLNTTKGERPSTNTCPGASIPRHHQLSESSAATRNASMGATAWRPMASTCSTSAAPDVPLSPPIVTGGASAPTSAHKQVQPITICDTI